MEAVDDTVRDMMTVGVEVTDAVWAPLSARLGDGDGKAIGDCNDNAVVVCGTADKPTDTGVRRSVVVPSPS